MKNIYYDTNIKLYRKETRNIEQQSLTRSSRQEVVLLLSQKSTNSGFETT